MESHSPIQFVDFAATSDFQVFPNPATTAIFISNAQPGRLFIYESNGKQIRNIEIEHDGILEIDVQEFPKGLYILKHSFGGLYKVLVE